MWRSTSVYSTAAGLPLVCILWRDGVLCPVSAAWHSCVAAHWSKYNCYKQTPLWYYLRWLVSWLCLTSIDGEVILRQHPHLLSLSKDVKLGFYTLPHWNRTPGRRVAVLYTIAAPRQHPNYDTLMFKRDIKPKQTNKLILDWQNKQLF